MCPMLSSGKTGESPNAPDMFTESSHASSHQNMMKPIAIAELDWNVAQLESGTSAIPRIFDHPLRLGRAAWASRSCPRGLRSLRPSAPQRHVSVSRFLTPRWASDLLRHVLNRQKGSLILRHALNIRQNGSLFLRHEGSPQNTPPREHVFGWNRAKTLYIEGDP